MRAVILNELKDLTLAGGSHELICVIKDYQRGPSLALGMTAIWRAMGSSTCQTVSARIFWPAAFG